MRSTKSLGKRLTENIAEALKFTLGYAAAFSLLIAVGVLVTGGAILARYRRPLHVVVLAHLAAALFVGLAAGIAGVFIRTRTAGALAGMLVGFLVAYVVLLAFRPEMSSSQLWIASSICAVVLGGPIGWMAIHFRVDQF